MTTKSLKKASQENKDWHPADIKAALHKAGITLAGIAKAHKINSSSSLSAALVRSSPAAEKRIADALGVHPKELWPSRYYANGETKPRGFRAIQFNAADRVVNGKKLMAA